MRARYILSDIGIGLRRNLTMTLALVVVMSVSLALFGTGLLMQAQASTTKGYWYDKVEISVFMCNEFDTGTQCSDGGVTEEQKQRIEDTLNGNPEVETVFFESQEQAYELFRERFQDSIADNITADQLQQSFRVKLRNPEQFEGVVSAVAGLPGVHQVVDQRALLGPMFEAIGRMQGLAWGAAAALLLAATLLVAVLIRVAALSRRRETSIMRLVGASNLYIQAPFVLEAAIAGLIGSALACGVLALLQELVVQRVFVTSFRFTAWVGWADVFAVFPWVVLVGVGISTLASFVTLRKYLRV